jgi:uncharacterized membrane protein
MQSLRPRLSLLGLCALMGGSGVLHFLAPRPYRRIVPMPLRAQAPAIVAVSGFCEVVCAVLLAGPRTRRVGAIITAALLVTVFPANVQMAVDSRMRRHAVLTWLRLPLQIPLVL